MKDIQEIINNFPGIDKEDMERRYQEYNKMIEQEFEMPDNYDTIPMTLKPLSYFKEDLPTNINKMKHDS